MNDSNIVETQEKGDGAYDDRKEWEEVMSQGMKDITELPAFRRYCDLFFTFSKKSPYHRRMGYERGFTSPPKKSYKKKEGVYDPRCFEGLVALHLDNPGDLYYWLALRFGKMSRLKCIDLDNKKHLLGYYKYHGHSRPVVHIPLDHFKSMKRVYDTFPNHIWCVSSATMELHIWERLQVLRNAKSFERTNRPRLVSIGLPDTEVYPSPQLKNQVLRRPFGRDYYTITEDRLLSSWDKQLEFFESATYAPPFTSIVDSLIILLRAEWDRCYWSGGFRPCSKSPFVSRRFLYRDRLNAEVEEVMKWVQAGCPLETLVRAEERPAEPEQPVQQVKVVRDRPGFGRWSWHQVKGLARHGVPEEHKLYKYLLLLARPLLWREYYHLEGNQRFCQTEDDLWFWVRHKHNGLVTRVLEGKDKEVKAEIKQQVRKAHESTSPSLIQFYAQMREKDKAYPERVEKLGDLIRNKERITSSPSCCKCINKEPEDTFLPGKVAAVVETIIKDKGMRRRDGEYPFARFARRLLKALWLEDGVAAINRETILGFCESKNPNQQAEYKRYMAESGLISDQWEAYVVRGTSSAVYQMTDLVFQMFQKHYQTNKPKRNLASRFRITALTEATLDAMDWGW